MRIHTLRQPVWSFIRLTRVVFLLGGFLLYALGAAVAARLGAPLRWTSYLLGQVVVTATQLMAHYANEYYDIEVDRLAAANRTWFSGGSGMLAAGAVSPGAVLVAARACAVIAILSGILATIISPWILPVVVISILGSWFYSAPPLTLMSSGCGELTTSVIVAGLAPAAGFVMQAGLPPAALWLVCVPLVLVHAAMLISFEFPDRVVDASAGKKTLTVRLGPKHAAWVVIALLAGAYLYLAALAVFSTSPGRWMAWAAPLAFWQIGSVYRAARSPTRGGYFLLTAGAVGLFALMALLALAGFAYSSPANR